MCPYISDVNPLIDLNAYFTNLGTTTALQAKQQGHCTLGRPLPRSWIVNWWLLEPPVRDWSAVSNSNHLHLQRDNNAVYDHQWWKDTIFLTRDTFGSTCSMSSRRHTVQQAVTIHVGLKRTHWTCLSSFWSYQPPKKWKQKTNQWMFYWIKTLHTSPLGP